MESKAKCTKAELIEMYEDAERELSEANDLADSLADDICRLETGQSEALNEAEEKLEGLKDPLRRLLCLIDDGRLVLVDPLFTLELREARNALRSVS